MVAGILSMKFSIITVVRNDLAGLERTFQSVAAQKFESFEWIVVDGASEDGSEAFCKSLDVKFPVRWVSEKDAGIYDAMNKGMVLASGEYVIFINAGDELLNEDTLLDVNPKVLDHDLYFFSAEVSSEKRVFLKTAKDISYLKHGLPTSHQAIFFKRDLSLEVKYDLRYKICGDYYLVSKMVAGDCTVRSYSDVVSRFYLGGASSKIFSPLIYEPYIIQRDILGISFWRRALSLCIRLSKNIILKLI